MQNQRLAAIPAWAPPSPFSSRLFAFALTLAAAAVLSLYHLRFDRAGLPYADDAYYYFVIARNLVDHGLSTFDGQTLTNGYHPLWLLVLAGEYALTRGFGWLPYLIELVLVLAGLFLILRARRDGDVLEQFALSLAYVLAVNLAALNGMEVSLFLFMLSALIFALARCDLSAPRAGIWIGFIGAGAIGARIDSAMFVLPLIGLALPDWRSRAGALAVIAVSGALYAGVNEFIFGCPIPISGAVKSLGGFQINRALIAGLAEPFAPDASPDSPSQDACFYWLFFLSGIVLVLLIAARPKPLTRRILLAFAIGMAAYCAKLFLFSSWRIWPWYVYPALVGAYGAIAAASDASARIKVAPLRVAAKLAAPLCLGLIVLGPLTRAIPAAPAVDFIGLNARGAVSLQPLLNGARVAMGDRAGSFAFVYDGPVTQLEGLVNDKAYLRVLESGGDLRALLCRRGVKFIADYEPDLGAYRNHEIAVLRPFLTAYRGPTLEVEKADEVAALRDRAIFDMHAYREDDSTLYVWRLSGCPAR